MAPKTPPLGTPTQTTATATKPDPYGLGQSWLDQEVDVGGIDGLHWTEATHTSRYGMDAADRSAYPISIGGMHPLGEVMSNFAELKGADLASIQQALYLGGFYNGNFKPTLGIMHNEDLNAFKDSLKLASGGGVGLRGFLVEAAKAGQDSGVGAQHNYEKITHVLRTTPENTIGETMDKAFKDAIGRVPTPSEKAKFIASFRARETAAQTNVFAAEDAARAGYIANAQSGVDSTGPISQTVGSQMPDLSSDVLTAAKTEHPTEYAGQQYLVAGNEFLKLLRSPL